MLGAAGGAQEHARGLRDVLGARSSTLGQPMLPHFPVPEGYDTDGYFRYVSREGLEKRFAEFTAARQER